MNTMQQMQKIIAETVKASKPCDIRYATISSVNPLSITLQNVQLTIESVAVTQLENTKELTIDSLEHLHQYTDTSDSGTENKETEKALSEIQCYLNGTGLGKTQDGKIILRKGLAVGDKVAVIRANGGQDYLILGRV